GPPLSQCSSLTTPPSIDLPSVPGHSKKPKTLSTGVIVAIVLIFGVQAAEKNKLVFLEGSVYNFDLEDLLRASAEVLGKGSYGTAYKAILD
ncbi:hypothetical protein Tco_1558948, partial [Tanacetum coccineum]